VLQAGRSTFRFPNISLDFSIYLILPAALSSQPLTEMSTRNFPGGGAVNDGRRARLTNLPPSMTRFSRENVGVLTCHNLMGLRDLLQ
jgi:hypothetical protein